MVNYFDFCLAFFFGAHAVIGLADWLDIMLVAVGLLLIAAEVFVIPGFGVTGVSGIVCLMLGIYMSLTKVTIPQNPWEFDRLRDAGVTLTTTSLSFMLFLYFVWKLLPHTPIHGWIVLSRTQETDEGFVVQTLSQGQAAIGLEGFAESVLRPAGRGRFEGKMYDIVTRGDFIQKGTRIVIVEAAGNRYVVDILEEDN